MVARSPATPDFAFADPVSAARATTPDVIVLRSPRGLILERPLATETLELRLDASPEHEAAFTSATLLPGRGMAVWRLGARVHGRDIEVLHGPAPAALDAFLERERFPGNATFGMGGAILLPFANRIRGRLLPDGRTLETVVDGQTVCLPANWSGVRVGAERFAMHGLVLDAAFKAVVHERSERADCARAELDLGDFGGRWPSRTHVTVSYELRSDAFAMHVLARNAGRDPLPMGIGWHPYFNVPSLRRDQVRLRVPARRRTIVNDYDEVLPTGVIEEIGGTGCDYSVEGGRALDADHLDDCFTDLVRDDAGEVASEVTDPAAGYGVRVVATTPEVRAFQVYAPRVHPYVVVEPQFNLADPYGAEWPAGTDTGMVRLAPGASCELGARIELMRLPRGDA